MAVGLATHDNVGLGTPNTSGNDMGASGSDVDPNRIGCKEEVFVDYCDICFYFEKQQQKVKWCKWTEGKETYSAVLCKPCFILLTPGGIL